MSRCQPSITCPKCGRTSWHPEDVQHQFCGVCGYHEFFVPARRSGKIERLRTIQRLRDLVRKPTR